MNLPLAKAAYYLALSELGTKEATGKNDGAFILMLQRWLALGSKWMDGQPWCAAFATWCVWKAAATLRIKPILPKNGSSTSLYAFAKKNHLLLTKPVPYCIGLVKGDGGTKGKTHHHTFIVEKVGDLSVYGIDGNYKNAVTRSVRMIKECDFIAVV